MEIITEVIVDSATANSCYSIMKQKYVVDGNEKTAFGTPDRRAVCPGEFDSVEEYIKNDVSEERFNELMLFFKTLWTEEVIERYQNLMKAQENIMPTQETPMPDLQEAMMPMM